MITCVLASEFHTKHGIQIKSTYPNLGEIENLTQIAAYMIPDGVHKHKSDFNYFRSKLNTKNPIPTECLPHPL